MPKQEGKAFRFARKASSIGGNALRSFARGRRRQLIYSRAVRTPLVGRIRGGRRGRTGRAGAGRPRGSYDPRYAQYGGVYGYRKQLAIQNAIARAQALRQSQITPQQEVILQQSAFRQQQAQQAPENQTIPDTKGVFRLRTIHQEAEDAANLFP